MPIFTVDNLVVPPAARPMPGWLLFPVSEASAPASRGRARRKRKAVGGGRSADGLVPWTGVAEVPRPGLALILGWVMLLAAVIAVGLGIGQGRLIPLLVAIPTGLSAFVISVRCSRVDRARDAAVLMGRERRNRHRFREVLFSGLTSSGSLARSGGSSGT